MTDRYAVGLFEQLFIPKPWVGAFAHERCPVSDGCPAVGPKRASPRWTLGTKALPGKLRH